jgi:hypothetical protein
MPFQVPLLAKEGSALAVRFHFGLFDLFGLGLKAFFMISILFGKVGIRIRIDGLYCDHNNNKGLK